MDRYSRVLAATDGSPDADAAVRLGARIAGRLGVSLLVVHVGDEDDDREAGERLLRDAEQAAIAASATDVRTEAVEGRAPDILLDRADDDPDQLVVVGSAGLAKASSRLVGSSSNRLTHHSRADVLFAKAPPPSAWNFVALTTDGSSTSFHAVRHGLRIAHALGARARLITAARTQEAGEQVLAATAGDLGLDASVEREVLVDPHPASAVAHAGWKYELVVIGNRGMSGPSRLLGSIANKITHELRTNLLLVNTTRG